MAWGHGFAAWPDDSSSMLSGESEEESLADEAPVACPRAGRVETLAVAIGVPPIFCRRLVRLRVPCEVFRILAFLHARPSVVPSV